MLGSPVSISDTQGTPFEQWRWITSNKMAHQVLCRGLSGGAVALLGLYIGIPKGEVANSIGLNRSTAYRKALRGETLPVHAGDCVLRLIDLAQHASATLGGMDAGRSWLKTKNPLLDEMAPIECISSSFGAQRAKEILLAVNDGLAQ
jgi:putative toxin-antitoxin system antitoxin component (TIGR02293 family)